MMMIQQAVKILTYIFVFAILIVTSHSDIKERKIFNRHVAFLFAGGFASTVFNVVWSLIYSGEDDFTQYIVGFFGGMLIVALPMLILALNKVQIGGGDIKLCAGVGCCIGVSNILTVFLAANIFALVKSGFCRIFLGKKITMKTSVPMAPYIAAAYLITVIPEVRKISVYF